MEKYNNEIEGILTSALNFIANCLKWPLKELHSGHLNGVEVNK